MTELLPHAWDTRGWHCTDEAQKAETVLSAVSYIYIYIYYQKEIHQAGTAYLVRFSCFSSQQIQKTCKGKKP